MDDQYLKRRLRETRQRLPSPDAVIQQCQNNVVMLLSRINMHEYSFFNETLILREHKSSMSLVNGEKQFESWFLQSSGCDFVRKSEVQKMIF